MAKDNGGHHPSDGRETMHDAAEFEFTDNWIRNRPNNSGSDQGCCYLILIGAAAFFILGILGMIFF